MTKVMRKEAWHTQRRDQASGVSLEIHLEWKQRTPLCSRIATGISWSSLGGLKGVKPPEAFGERSRDWSLGHAGDEGLHLSMTGESRGCSRAAAPVCCLTDFCHPCQVLADLMTIREYKGSFQGLKMCYIGDGNNMANSLIVGGLKVGMEVSIACPKAYQPDEKVLAFAKANGGFTMTDSPIEAAAGADVIFTDVWASMGQEGEAQQRKIAFAGYQVNDALLEAANPECMVQHCLPAHRGEEITAEVFEAHAKEIFDEAENRLHAQKAVLVKVMG